MVLKMEQCAAGLFIDVMSFFLLDIFISFMLASRMTMAFQTFSACVCRHILEIAAPLSAIGHLHAQCCDISSSFGVSPSGSC